MTIEADIYQMWSIKFPYGRKYLYFGPQNGAKEKAKKLQKSADWPYPARIKSVKI